jgi:bacterioferritin (cytochrome b1)
MTHEEQIAKLTEMLEIQQKLHETAIDMLKPAIEIAVQKEREACAKLVDYWEAREGEHADAIRARGQA